MGRRLELQSKLEDILGSKNVYYQPPENLKMKYPCFVYEDHVTDSVMADNDIYLDEPAWDVTFIRTFQDREKNNQIRDSIRHKFMYSRWITHFISDNLIHDAYLIYY